MVLSERLAAVAGLVSDGSVIADIGTDHAYIPIYLIESGKCPKAVAMDVNAGPLLRAQKHIAAHQLEPYIEIRQADGLSGLKSGEAGSAILAGMGGGLVIKILSQSPLIAREIKEFILQPQSELYQVRKFVNEWGMAIQAEDIIFEDGKYYPMMRANWGQEKPYDDVELHYGRYLIQNKHPVLKQFLKREIQVKEQIVSQLNDAAAVRRNEIEAELLTARIALERMGI